MDGVPNGDFGSGEFRPLGDVSGEDKSDESFVGLIALSLFFDPLGIGGKGCVVASVAIEEATGWVVGGRVGRVSLLPCLNAVTTSLGAFSDLLVVEALQRVHTIFAGLRKQSKNKDKEEER